MLQILNTRRKFSRFVALIGVAIIGSAGMLPTAAIATNTTEDTPTAAGAASPPPRPAISSFEVQNPKEGGFAEGDTIRFLVTLKNDTEKARAFGTHSSNLTNATCRWWKIAPNETKRDCTMPYHKVTAQDVALGSFTPRITWIMRDSASHSAAGVNLAETVGEPIPVAAKVAEISALTITSGTGKTAYKVGDKFGYEFTINSLSKAQITITGAQCQKQVLTPGENTRCTGSYTVNAADLQRGSAEIVATATVADARRLVNLSKSTQVAVPRIWEQATGFKAFNADPRLAPEISELTYIDRHTDQYNIRIPALTTDSNGDLIAAYDLRPLGGQIRQGGDSPNENSIVQRRSTDQGKNWGPRTVIAQGKVAGAGERYGWSDPSYVVDHTTGEIFAFFVGSLDAGFGYNPNYAMNPDGTVNIHHRSAMNFTVANSKDNGHTWQRRTITNEVLGSRATQVRGCFATSGAGIQKMHEPHKDRLIQQAACLFPNGRFKALSIFSDDHGKTWQSGEFVSDSEGANGNSWNFDENKVTELSDGRLMLNSRIPKGSYGQGYRLTAISSNGGKTWGEYKIDHALQDSQNNAHLMRAFPTAKADTLRAKVLLFSNTKHHWERKDGHVSMSYDDGKTWPVSKQIRTGMTGYTVMTPQKDGKIGLLMEPAGFNDIAYLNFTLRYLTDNLPFEAAIPGTQTIRIADGTPMNPAQITVNGNDPVLADHFAITGLPAGLEFDPRTGTITGTPNLGNAAEQQINLQVTFTEADDGTGIPRQATGIVKLTILPAGANPNDSAWKIHNLATADYQQLKARLQDEKPMNWLFTGDSITHGVVHSNGLKRFSEYFEDVLRTHSILCQNRSKDVVLNTGVSSATSSWMAQYWDSFVAQRNADVVFITYGMNDGRANKPVTDLAQFKTNLSTAIDKIRESGAIPILMTQNDTRQAQANKNLSPYFAAEREMARAKHVMMIDYNSWWQENGDGGANTAWMNDDLHPNQIGHLNWAKFILQELGLAKDARLMATAQAQVPASGTTVKTRIQSFAGASGLSINGLKYAPKKNFDGSAADQITAGVPENTAANNGNITVRFRMDEARNGVNYVLAALEDEQSAKVVTVGVYNGEIRVGRDLGNGQNYGYYTRGGANPGDGNFHIASINYGQNGLTIYLDGQKLAPISGWTQPPSFFAADKLTVGGFGRSYSAGQTFSHLKGAIDYVEVYGQNLTEEQIASLGNDAAPVAAQLRNLYASTQPQMWAFLGGATTQGTLPEISAKNYVQAFEEVVRWEYRSNPAGMRMKFVQNAGLNGLSAKDLLARYDAVIAAQNPNVMVISPDVKFKNKLVETSVADFTAHILALVEKATAANTYVILMSPAQLGADIAEYAQALKQIAAEKKLTYVDGYEWLAAVAANNASGVVAQEWFDANSFMRAKGQIELAKHFMGVIQMLPENLGTSKIWALNYDGDGTPATLNVPDYRQGECPSENPVQPDVNPGQPGGTPDQPGGDVDQPGADPAQPGGNVDQPGADPVQPDVNPVQPGGDQAQPDVNPAQPGGTPDQPGVDPAQPGGKIGSSEATKPEQKLNLSIAPIPSLTLPDQHYTHPKQELAASGSAIWPVIPALLLMLGTGMMLTLQLRWKDQRRRGGNCASKSA